MKTVVKLAAIALIAAPTFAAAGSDLSPETSLSLM